MSLGALAGVATDPEKVKLVIAAILGLLISGAAIFGSFYKVPSSDDPGSVVRAWSCSSSGSSSPLLVKGRAPASGVLADLSSGGDA